MTDQPRERPTNGPLLPAEREKHVVLSLTTPSSAHVDVTIPLVTAVFTFIDSLSRCNLRPETKMKIKRTREDIDKNLKEEMEREKKEEVYVPRPVFPWLTKRLGIPSSRRQKGC